MLVTEIHEEPLRQRTGHVRECAQVAPIAALVTRRSDGVEVAPERRDTVRVRVPVDAIRI